MTTDAQILAIGSLRIRNALRVLRYIQGTRFGATSDDCTQALNIPHGSCSPRFKELENAGCIEKTGTSRRTTSGGRAHVYRVKSKDFQRYLAYLRTRKPVVPDVNREKHLVRACEAFLRKWRGGKTSKTDGTKALRALVAQLEKAPTRKSKGT
jgi:hypothetical protein